MVTPRSRSSLKRSRIHAKAKSSLPHLLRHLLDLLEALLVHVAGLVEQAARQRGLAVVYVAYYG
jgi:hypothetical protein